MRSVTKLLEEQQRLQERRSSLVDSRQAITDGVAAQGRHDLSVAETAMFRQTEADIATIDAALRDISAELERWGYGDDGAAKARRASFSVTEHQTYARGNGESYFKDFLRVQRQMDATGDSRERLRRHGIDVATGREYRDMDRVDGNGGYFTPPAWLVNQYASLARAGRVYANLVQQQPLPSGTDSINIPKITSGTSTAMQTADNAAVQETDPDDASIQANVKTNAGQTDVAIQLLDQSPINFDEVLFQDLYADYATKIDRQVLAGTNSNGQVKGVHATPGIATIAISSLTLAKFYAAVADAIQRIHTTRFLPPTHIVMHPRRWAWLTATLDSQGRPLVVPNAQVPTNSIASFGEVTSEGFVGTMQGLPVAVDANIGTTYGSGNDEDLAYVQRSSDLLLYESGIRSRVLNEVGGKNLTVCLQVYGYLAFTAERYPQSVVEISGLTPPTFG